MLLASCDIEDAKKYRNKLVLISEKETKKPEEVWLNILTDEPDDVLKQGIGSAKCVTSSTKPTSCPKDLWGNVFHEVKYEDYKGVDEVDGVVCLVRLPEGFCDMRKAEELCKVNKDYTDVEAKVRLIGGNLLEIPSVAIGRYNKGKEKMSAVFNGVYDIFKELHLEDIEVKEVMSKVRSSSSGKSSPKASKSKLKKAESLSKFFGDSCSEF